MKLGKRNRLTYDIRAEIIKCLRDSEIPITSSIIARKTRTDFTTLKKHLMVLKEAGVVSCDVRKATRGISEYNYFWEYIPKKDRNK